MTAVFQNYLQWSALVSFLSFKLDTICIVYVSCVLALTACSAYSLSCSAKLDVHTYFSLRVNKIINFASKHMNVYFSHFDIWFY